MICLIPRIVFLAIIFMIIPGSCFGDTQSSEKQGKMQNARIILGGDGGEIVSLYQLNYAIMGSDTEVARLHWTDFHKR